MSNDTKRALAVALGIIAGIVTAYSFNDSPDMFSTIFFALLGATAGEMFSPRD